MDEPLEYDFYAFDFDLIFVMGSHWQSPEELIDMVHKYYADTALPKLVRLSIIRSFGGAYILCSSGLYLYSFIYNRFQILGPLNSHLLMEEL